MHRALTTIALLASIALPATAQDTEEPDPTDLVPRYYSTETFARLSALDLYDINLALKRGRTIHIEGCTASQSRTVFKASLDNRAPAVDLLNATCAG